MATHRGGHKPGGGIASRVNVQPSVRTGSGSKGISPGWVGQKGQMQGNKITHVQGTTNYTGEKKFTGQNFNPVPYGNQVALNVGQGGPGKGREVMRTGSQGVHGAPAQGAPGSLHRACPCQAPR